MYMHDAYWHMHNAYRHMHDACWHMHNVYWYSHNLIVILTQNTPHTGRPKSEFSFIHHCVLCVIGVNTSLETVVLEKEDPPSRRAGRPKSEFSFIHHCVATVCYWGQYFFRDCGS